MFSRSACVSCAQGVLGRDLLYIVMPKFGHEGIFMHLVKCSQLLWRDGKGVEFLKK